MSSWDDEPVPQRKWAILGRVPLLQAGLFSGEGGTGKSILEMTKDVAHVAGKDLRDTLRSLHTTRSKLLVGLALPFSCVLYAYDLARATKTKKE